MMPESGACIKRSVGDVDSENLRRRDRDGPAVNPLLWISTQISSSY